MTAPAVRVGTSAVSLDDLERVARQGAPVVLAPEAIEAMQLGRAVVERALAGSEPVYGLTTGLGHQQDEAVDTPLLSEYQRRMIRAHQGGIGPPLGAEDVRAIMFARVVGMCKGASGAHPQACASLVAMLNADILPIVPLHGSVGASDLMHLAAIAAVLIGEGSAHSRGQVVPGGHALREAGLEPYVPLPKDGLALISANAASIGMGALTALDALRIADLADRASMLSLEAIGGNPSIIDPEVARAKPLPGNLTICERLAIMLTGSYVYDTSVPRQLQDPLSFRVVPQVHGALCDALTTLRLAVETELNAVDDNPLVSIPQNRLISNGNFHPMQLAVGFDAVRVALAHVALLAERRLNKTAPHTFGSPGDPDGPVNRPIGLELSSYTAAALVAEIRYLAAPATLDCPPLDLGTEDHATLAVTTVRRTREALANLEALLLIEALLAVDRLEHRDPIPALGAGTGQLFSLVERTLDTCKEGATVGQVVEALRRAYRMPIGAERDRPA
jgi:histidine ammonia-lyase